MPDDVMQLIWLCMKIGIAGTFPLLSVFVIMVYKPDIPKDSEWFTSSDSAQEINSEAVKKSD